MEFGYIRTGSRANVMIVAGHYGITEDDTAAAESTVTLAGVGNTDSTKDTVFYDVIYLGDTIGANGVTVANKKVTLNIIDGTDYNANNAVWQTQVANLYTSSSSSVNCAGALENCEVIVNQKDTTQVANVSIFNKRVNAWLPTLTYNLLDNSTFSTTSEKQFINGENVTINISDKESGRTTAITNQFGFFGYGNDEKQAAAKVTMNFGCGSSTRVEAPKGIYRTSTIGAVIGGTSDMTTANGYTEEEIYAAAEKAITLNVTGAAHAWGDGEVTTAPAAGADGVRTYTCADCGKTKTAVETWDCTVYGHAFVNKADGTTVCAYECGTAYAAGEVTVSIDAGSVVPGASASIPVNVATTTDITALSFTVSMPEGMTLAGWEDKVASETESEDPLNSGWMIAGGEDLVSPYMFAMLHLGTEEVPSEDGESTETVLAGAPLNQVVVILNVTVDETYEGGVITVSVKEAYTASEEAVNAVGVSAEIFVATEEPECTHENTKLVPNNNGTHNVVCADETCGVVVEENVPCTMEEVEGSAVAPDFGAEGKKADTACDCGYTVTGESIPALVAVAMIGETKYETVQAAVDAVDVLGTVTVLDGVTETVTPAKTFYLAGDVDGITVAEASGYVLHSTTVDQYTGDVAVKNIVRPAEATYRQISSNTTLTYEAAIKMDFYAVAGVMDEYADFYAVLTLNATEPRTYVITDKIGGTLQGNAAYKYTFPMIAAKEMGDTIDCTFFGIKADGTVEYRTRTSSVLDYCTGKLSDPTEATLMASILNYGAYAQTFFGYKTDAMVNANVPTELQAAYAETFENTVATKVNSRQDVEGITNLLAAQQTALNFEDSIQLNVQMLFNNADIANGVEDLTFVATFADETVEISGADWAMSDFNATQKMASLYITTIPAKQMRETVTYTLYRNYGTEDEVQVNGYRMVGIEEHITKAATSNTISEAEKILNRAILVYADAANAYFAK